MSEAESCIPASGGAVRTAQIGVIHVISVASSAAVQIGDRGETNARLHALAVQRAENHSTAGDVYFESYPMFTRPYPKLRDAEFEAGAALSLVRRNECPYIRVGCIRVIAAGAAASIQAGNNMRIKADSRIKHTRQFPVLPPNDESQPAPSAATEAEGPYGPRNGNGRTKA